MQDFMTARKRWFLDDEIARIGAITLFADKELKIFLLLNLMILNFSVQIRAF